MILGYDQEERQNAPFSLTITKDAGGNPFKTPKTKHFNDGAEMYDWYIQMKGKPPRRKRKSKDDKKRKKNGEN